MSVMCEERVIHTEHPFGFEAGAGETRQLLQAGSVQLLQRKRASRQQTVQGTLVAAFDDEQPIDAIHRLVLGDDQTADVALEFDERVRRENAFEERSIMLHDSGKFDQRKHGTPP